MNKKEAILKVYNSIKKETAKKAISIELKKQKTQLIDSKVGGTPYLPVGAEIPVDDDGRQLTLLAQINCGELVGMKDYPQKGLLQFFILMDDCYGLDFDNQNKQNTFRVVYHDSIDDNVKEEDILKIYNPYIEDEDYMPFEDEFKMVFTTYEEGITSEDFNFDEIFVKKYNELFPNNQIQAFWDLDDDNEGKESFDDILEEINDEISGCGNKIGGYPYFAQSDPREYDGLDVYDTLLLQIDSMDDYENGYIMWGDCGVCNFFINKDKLKNLDFSDVLYNWDCY